MTTEEQLKLLRSRLEKVEEDLSSLYEQINELFTSEYNAQADSAEDPDNEDFLDSVAAWDQAFEPETDTPSAVIDAINAALGEEP